MKVTGFTLCKYTQCRNGYSSRNGNILNPKKDGGQSDPTCCVFLKMYLLKE